MPTLSRLIGRLVWQISNALFHEPGLLCVDWEGQIGALYVGSSEIRMGDAVGHVCFGRVRPLR